MRNYQPTAYSRQQTAKGLAGFACGRSYVDPFDARSGAGYLAERSLYEVRIDILYKGENHEDRISG